MEIDEIRSWLMNKAREEYWAAKTDSEPFSWAAARLTDDEVGTYMAEKLDDAARAERERFVSWLQHAAAFMVSKCRTHQEVCDKLAEYVKRGVY